MIAKHRFDNPSFEKVTLANQFYNPYIYIITVNSEDYTRSRHICDTCCAEDWTDTANLPADRHLIPGPSSPSRNAGRHPTAFVQE